MEAAGRRLVCCRVVEYRLGLNWYREVECKQSSCKEEECI